MLDIKTKRFLYQILISVCSKKGCHSVLGARKVGKTALFLQLDEYFADKSTYFDCTSLMSDTSFSFEDFYENAVNSGKEVIFLDEVCKINNHCLANFIMSTKLYSHSLCILFTGSDITVVKKRMNQICRGIEFNLPPFLYIERLCWKHGYDEVNLDAIKELTSDLELKEYLKSQPIPPKEILDCMQGIEKRIISSSDGFYRNDKIVACMELEYIDLLRKQDLYSKLDISQLISKYEFN